MNSSGVHVGVASFGNAQSCLDITAQQLVNDLNNQENQQREKVASAVLIPLPI